MKVVFGGAFNPVTKAHIEVYKHVMKNVEADEFLFLPVSNEYTKSDLASNYHRVAMLELATADFDDVSICKLEIEDSDFKGTYQSLSRLSDQYNTDLYFVVGADNLLDFDKWINVEGILSEFTIIVLGRDGIDIDQVINDNEVLKKHKHRFIIFKDFVVDISSTSFRKTMNKNDVDENVFEYITKNQLYRGDS